MSYIFINTATGRLADVQTPEEAKANSTDPERAELRQKNLVEKMKSSKRWDFKGESQWDATMDSNVGNPVAPYATEPRPVPAAPVKAEPVRPAAPTQSVTPSQVEVRDWAIANGIEVSTKGRIPNAVIDQYLNARGA